MNPIIPVLLINKTVEYGLRSRRRSLRSFIKKRKKKGGPNQVFMIKLFILCSIPQPISFVILLKPNFSLSFSQAGFLISQPSSYEPNPWSKQSIKIAWFKSLVQICTFGTYIHT